MGKKPMNRDDIKSALKSLACSQGFYGRLIEQIESLSEENKERFWQKMEAKKFSDTVDLVMYLEC